MRTGKRSANAYQMRLALQDTNRSQTASTTRRRFQVWRHGVRWVARCYKASLLTPMVKLLQMIKTNWRASWQIGSGA